MPNENAPPPAEPLIGWTEIYRHGMQRTSTPTDTLCRMRVGEIAAWRGLAPNADAVLLAALELADAEALRQRVLEIESRQFPAEYRLRPKLRKRKQAGPTAL